MGETPKRWQQQKSAETRTRILDATVDCLVEKGYAGLSTNEVTVRAGISRGAMHHHFQSRLALVADVIEHIFYQRMEGFLSGYFKAMRARGEVSISRIGVEEHWKSVQTREYAAFIELAVAARTDAELNNYFEPAARRFDKVWTQEMIKSFPQWEEHWDRLQIASDLTMAAHMGLLLYMPSFGDRERVARVREAIAKTVETLHFGDI